MRPHPGHRTHSHIFFSTLDFFFFCLLELCPLTTIMCYESDGEVLPTMQTTMRMRHPSSYRCLFVLLVIISSGLLGIGEGCRDEERRALLLIKDSVNYSGDDQLSTWVGKDCCQWDGIKCDNATSRVVLLVLSDVRMGAWRLNATLLSNFKELRSLDLSSNQMGGDGTELLQVICQFIFLEYLSLAQNWMGGVIPPCFGNLTSLTTVYLWGNRFQGDIPSLSNLNSLETLNLGNNRFQRMLTLFGRNHSSASSLLKNLTSLYVGDNQLIDDGWDLFQAICQVGSLVGLDLGRNSLVGRIHPCLGSMRSLSSFDVSGNQLQGSLPPSLGNMESIRELDLSNNRFEGNLPLNLGNLSSIWTLDLSHNQLQGNIPSSLFKHLNLIRQFDISKNEFVGVLSFSTFANLTDLDSLDLSSNKDLEIETDSPSWVSSFQLSLLKLSNCVLNKHSGRKIPMFLSNQSNLREVDLSHSSLTGNIHPWLLQNVGVTLWLQDNMFHSILLPSQGNVSHRGPAALDISNNRIFGTLPLASYDLSTDYLNMSSNLLQGSIPSSYNLLRIVDLSNNNLTGEISRGLTANRSSLVYLALSYNRLVGDILSRDSNMTELRYLKLQNNLFTGLIPHILSNSPVLILLDLRHNNLSGDISSSLPLLPYLRAFLIGGNHFEGNIPKKLCEMKFLQFVDLSVNNFSGEIPFCLSVITFMRNQSLLSDETTIGEIPQLDYPSDFDPKSIRVTTDFTTKGISYSYEGAPLTLMSGIDMSCNQLIGGIPHDIGDLQDLRALNLSNNRLTGSLPTSFQDMENLESLDLSHNKLSGAIPIELAQLDSLSTFNVAFNKLSGKIPYVQKFLTFEQSSFVGNDLCGPPLERNCSVNSLLPQPNLHEADEEEVLIENTLFFYSWVAISYALGFWVVIALFIFKKNWRHKFFTTVDEWIEKCEEKIWRFMKYFKVCQ